MGMFDSVYVADVEYQTKAFGKCLKRYQLGDLVTLERAPVTLEDYENPEESTVEAPEEYQVMVLGEDYCWLQVHHNVLQEVTKERKADLPAFDYYGRPYDEDDPHVQ